MPDAHRTRSAGAALIEVCHGRAPLLPARHFDRTVRLLRHHRLSPLAHVVLAREGRPEAALLRPDLVTAAGGHVRNLAALRLVTDQLQDLPWAILKGPLLSALAHPVPGVRLYSDLDVLVRPADFAESVHRLTDGGWRLLDRDHRLVRDRLPGEVHLLGPFGAQLDLHWSLVNGRRARAAVSLPTGELLRRRVWRQLGASAVPSLDDVDVLVHLCLHAALSGADRMLWLLDVDQWVRGTSPDWAEVRERAMSGRCVPALLVVLSRARRILATPVPLRALDPSPAYRLWRLVDAGVAGLQPVEQVVGKRSLPRLLARSSRADVLNSAVELARRTGAATARQREVESAWEDRPDEEAWRGFLREVAQQE